MHTHTHTHITHTAHFPSNADLSPGSYSLANHYLFLSLLFWPTRIKWLYRRSCFLVTCLLRSPVGIALDWDRVNSTHPSMSCTAYPTQGREGLGAGIPGDCGYKAGDTLGGVWTHRRAHSVNIPHELSIDSLFFKMFNLASSWFHLKKSPYLSCPKIWWNLYQLVSSWCFLQVILQHTVKQGNFFPVLPVGKISAEMMESDRTKIAEIVWFKNNMMPPSDVKLTPYE